MDSKHEDKVPTGKLLLVVALTMIVTTLTISLAFAFSRGLLGERLFEATSSPEKHVHQFSKNTRWIGADRLDLSNRKYTIVRLEDLNVCYLMPYDDDKDDVPFEAQPMTVLDDQLDLKTLNRLGGREASLFCSGAKTFLVVPLKLDEAGRRRRQASGYPETGIFATAVDKGRPALEVDIEDRHPRCVNVLLDCFNHVGQVQLCYTWQNGAMFMERKCLDKNKFEIKMTKPPGRILKVAQQQLVLCLERKEKGLDC